MEKFKAVSTISVAWDDDEHKRVIWNFAAGWTWNDFHACLDITEQMGIDGGNTLDVILYMPYSAITPVGSSASAHIRRGMEVVTRQGGISVIAGGNAFTRTVIMIFKQVYGDLGSKFFVAATVENARQLISDYRVKIPITTLEDYYSARSSKSSS